ncbi:hypothetical protein SAMN04488005_1531 [Yoonia tamlensis]|uniref:Uncharacterized protein n=2 Tax=Yoonia tamlensis TaxID=390270 RepID=A0A1I6GEU0_9RHOB|nr:hypothetical protein SAMN04488005_1531 [Yoonia tamlensis]
MDGYAHPLMGLQIRCANCDRLLPLQMRETADSSFNGSGIYPENWSHTNNDREFHKDKHSIYPLVFTMVAHPCETCIDNVTAPARALTDAIANITDGKKAKKS